MKTQCRSWRVRSARESVCGAQLNRGRDRGRWSGLFPFSDHEGPSIPPASTRCPSGILHNVRKHGLQTARKLCNVAVERDTAFGNCGLAQNRMEGGVQPEKLWVPRGCPRQNRRCWGEGWSWVSLEHAEITGTLGSDGATQIYCCIQQLDTRRRLPMCFAFWNSRVWLVSNTFTTALGHRSLGSVSIAIFTCQVPVLQT